MATNKITFEMGLIHDAEVLRALENFQKVIGSIGDSSKTFGEKLGAAGKDLSELAKQSSAAAIEFKKLTTASADAGTALSQGLLDEKKIGNLKLLNEGIKATTNAINEKKAAIKALSLEEEEARRKSDMAAVQEIRTRGAALAQEHYQLVRERNEMQGTANDLTYGPVFASSRAFGQQVANGQFSIGGAYKYMQSLAPELTGIGLGGLALGGAAVTMAANEYNRDLSPEARMNAEIFMRKNRMAGFEDIQNNNFLRARMRAEGTGTTHRVLSGQEGFLATVAGLTNLTRWGIEGALKGQDPDAYARAKGMAVDEPLDLARFNMLQDADRFQMEFGRRNLGRSRAFGTDALNRSFETYALQGLSEDNQKLGAAALFRFQSRQAGTGGQDFEFMRAERDYGLHESSINTIAMRYQNNTAQGTMAARTALASAGLGVQDEAARGSFEDYINGQVARYGSQVDISGVSGVMGRVIADVTSNIGGAGKAEATTHAIGVVNQIQSNYQSPGTLRNTLLKTQLMSLGIEPGMADIFIQRGVQNDETRKAMAMWIGGKDAAARVDKAVNSTEGVVMNAQRATLSPAAWKRAKELGTSTSFGAGATVNGRAMTVEESLLGTEGSGSVNPEDAAAYISLAKGGTATPGAKKAPGKNDAAPPNLPNEDDKNRSAYQAALLKSASDLSTIVGLMKQNTDGMLKELQKQNNDYDSRRPQAPTGTVNLPVTKPPGRIRGADLPNGTT